VQNRLRYVQKNEPTKPFKSTVWPDPSLVHKPCLSNQLPRTTRLVESTVGGLAGEDRAPVGLEAAWLLDGVVLRLAPALRERLVY
jgi:hypothetical protein